MNAIYLYAGGAGCVSSNCAEIVEALEREIGQRGLTRRVNVIQTGCMGICAAGPVMLVLPERIFYTNLTPQKYMKLPRII